eukprot:COSAG03_NODE_1445_length_4071_cov_82.462739_4_plen_182_part_00
MPRPAPASRAARMAPIHPYTQVKRRRPAAPVEAVVAPPPTPAQYLRKIAVRCRQYCANPAYSADYPRYYPVPWGCPESISGGSTLNTTPNFLLLRLCSGARSSARACHAPQLRQPRAADKYMNSLSPRPRGLDPSAARAPAGRRGRSSGHCMMLSCGTERVWPPAGYRIRGSVITDRVART